MTQMTKMFGGAAGLAVAAFAGLMLFTLIGGLIIAAGVVLTTLVVGGGIYAIVTGRHPFSVQRGRFEADGVRIFDLRSGEIRTMQVPSEGEMIDVTPPRGPRGTR